jgi:hypothetical protein
MAVFSAADARPLFDNAEWVDLFSEGGSVPDPAREDAVRDAAEAEMRLLFASAGVAWPPSADVVQELKGVFAVLFRYHAYVLRRGAVPQAVESLYRSTLEGLRAFAEHRAAVDAKTAGRPSGGYRIVTTEVQYDALDILGSL